MFENFTTESILEDALARAPAGIDTRQGSIFYDAVAALADVIAKFYSDFDVLLGSIFIDSAEGAALDSKAEELNMFRRAATPARYAVEFSGAMPEAGERFYSGDDEIYFVLKENKDGFFLEAETAGADGNAVYAGTNAVPVYDIDGLQSATFGSLIEAGADEETDESLRGRIKEKLSAPAENGNAEHYKMWCESVDGIGRAYIYPLWNGPNTVKAVLVNNACMPCSDELVAAVQQYVDPATKGYTTTVDGKTYVVGDGLGEGIANIGAHFTATTADSFPLNISVYVELKSPYTLEDAERSIKENTAEYLKGFVLQNANNDSAVIRLSIIGSMISTLNCVNDYNSLLINGATTNISLSQDQIPFVGEVTVHEIL